jgi:hypothetical protein
MEREPIEFDCIDCDVHVYIYVINTTQQIQTERCSSCEWLHFTKLPEEKKEELRKLLNWKGSNR